MSLFSACFFNIYVSLGFASIGCFISSSLNSILVIVYNSNTTISKSARMTGDHFDYQGWCLTVSKDIRPMLGQLQAGSLCQTFYVCLLSLSMNSKYPFLALLSKSQSNLSGGKELNTWNLSQIPICHGSLRGLKVLTGFCYPIKSPFVTTSSVFFLPVLSLSTSLWRQIAVDFYSTKNKTSFYEI